MTREDHEKNGDDFAKGNISAGAFVLFQQIRIGTLEAQLKDAGFAITVLNENLRLNGELLKEKAEEIKKLKKLVNDFNNTYSVGDFDFESYYAMLKDTQ